MLAADEAVALRHAAEVELERDIYRMMAQLLLKQAHEQDALVTRQRDTIRHLADLSDDTWVRSNAKALLCHLIVKFVPTFHAQQRLAAFVRRMWPGFRDA